MAKNDAGARCRKTSQCWSVSVPYSGWRVQSDTEDAVIKINQLSQPLSQSQSGK